MACFELSSSNNVSEYLLLHDSVEHGDLELTQYLLQKNYDVNAKDCTSGNTALMLAIKYRHEKIIEILLEAEADLMLRNHENKSSLDIFCADHLFSHNIREIVFSKFRKQMSTIEEAVQRLLDAKCFAYQVVYLRDWRIFQQMVERKLPIWSMNSISKQTELHISVLLECIDIVRFLLQCNSQLHESNHKKIQYPYVNSQDCNGITPLMIAVMYEQEITIQILLEAEADLTIRNHEGKSALDMFCAEPDFSLDIQKLVLQALYKKFSNSDDVAQTLLDAGYQTHQMIVLNDIKIAEYMLKKKLSVHCVHPFTLQTPLHISILEKNVDMINLLLKYSHTSTSETTFLDQAFKHSSGEEKRTQDTLQRNYYVNAQDIDGWTPLMLSMRNKDWVITEILLTAGADLTIKNKYNKSVLDLYFEENHISPEFQKFVFREVRDHFCTSENTAQALVEKIRLWGILFNQKVSPTSCNSLGFFQLKPFLLRGNRELIRLILKSNIDLRAEDEANKCSVLHYLSANTNPGIVDELKLHHTKFNVNVVDRSNMSPLHIAMKFSNIAMLEFLLNQKVEPNCAHSLYNYTPLYYAFKKRDSIFGNQWSEERSQCVELLLQHDANPQIIVTEGHTKITVFDAASETNNLDKVEPVVAYLAVQEGIGVRITEYISTNINLYTSLKKYFRKCQKLLQKNISGSVTLLKLLTSDDRKITRYSGNKRLMLKLKRLSYKQNLKSLYRYYSNTLKRRISKGIQNKKYECQIAEAICEMFQNRVDQTNLVVDKIIYMLWRLKKSSNPY